jgi:DNA ligase-1
MLAPNEKTDINIITYPLLGSYKLDGIRCLFINGQMLSRAFKPIRNVHLQTRFESLKQYSKDNNMILDGELYAKGMSFQQITHYVMSEDEVVPFELKFWCFDCVKDNNLNTPFKERIRLIPIVDIIVKVEQKELNTAHDVQNMFEEALNIGFEGLILKSPNSYYKCGRGTLKEGLIYKVKPFETFDGEITEVIQGTKVKDEVERTQDNFGNSKTSIKKDDRELVEKASAFRVKYNGTTLKVSLAMTDEEKEEVWRNQKNYIGKYIEYKGMSIGQKDVPRHPIYLRMRLDK